MQHAAKPSPVAGSRSFIDPSPVQRGSVAHGEARPTPSYRFRFEIVDASTGEVVIADFCSLGSIDPFGGSEAVDMHVAAMLRAFSRTARAEHERANSETETVGG